MKKMYIKKGKKDKMIRNVMEIERRNHRILDSKNRICQKINDNSDKKDSNIRKDSKNRNGPVMRSHHRSPVIKVCNMNEFRIKFR